MRILVAFFIITVVAASARETTPTLRQMAMSGDIDAMVVLGARYLYGDGEKTDDKEAERWYRMAAIRRDFDGAFGMATIYVNRRDYVSAYSWFALYADEEIGLQEARDEILTLIPKSRRQDALNQAKSLKQIVLKEQGELLLREIEKSKEGRTNQ